MEENINNNSMLSVGSILRGIYRIDRYLSSGGFGNTYVATNIEFDEVVAIKEFFIKGVTQRDINSTTVSVSNSENEALFAEQLQKFKKEAKRLRKLNNEHIVKVHDLFEENGTAYYVMNYIDGENLSVKLRRLHCPLSEKEVMAYLPQILDALDCVHSEGLWHLDLKPANILVDKAGNVTLIDFGASKQRNSSGGATTSTAVSYTNGYAPREQMEQNLEKFGPWTDLYALGATLYNLLTNTRPPMPSDIDDDRSSDKHAALPFNNNISERTKQLILKLLTTDRLCRPQSVNEVRNLIEGIKSKDEEDSHTVADNEETIVIEKNPKSEENSQTLPLSNNSFKSQAAVVNDSQIKSSNTSSIFNIFLTLTIICLALLGLFIMGFINKNNKNKELSAPVDTTVVFTPEEFEDSAAADTAAAAYIGRFNNTLGSFDYYGECNNANLPDGYGYAVFENGNSYEGPFVNGNMEGENAVYKYKIGDVYEGAFKNNTFSYGKYTVAQNGEYFIGSFKDGNPYHGTWYDKRGNVLERIN